MRIIVTEEGISIIKNLSFTINKEKKDKEKKQKEIKKNKSQVQISRTNENLLTIPKLNIFQNINFKPVNVPLPINTISLKIPESKKKKKIVFLFQKKVFL